MQIKSPSTKLTVAALAGLLTWSSTPDAVSAQDGNASLFGNRSASVTYGPYARLEFGGAMPNLGDAYWLPPGDDDPRIDFAASGSDVGFGAFAIGYDWQNGFRADLSFFGMNRSDVTAPCSGASDGSDCSTHANISDASVSTKGAMANVFYVPFEARGSSSIFQPFVVAGLGIAHNDVGDWTRENLSPPPPENPDRRELRTFEGDASSGLAWSIGVGASLQVTRPGKWPVMIEAAWRYYDFGTASGGSVPLPENGTRGPREPFTFENEAQVVTFGIRVPLQRY